jgi:hypothetical protein
MQIEKVEGVPMLTQYCVTILLKDIPHSEYFYSSAEVKLVLNKLDKLGKKYILSASVHPVH